MKYIYWIIILVSTSLLIVNHCDWVWYSRKLETHISELENKYMEQSAELVTVEQELKSVKDTLAESETKYLELRDKLIYSRQQARDLRLYIDELKRGIKHD